MRKKLLLFIFTLCSLMVMSSIVKADAASDYAIFQNAEVKVHGLATPSLDDDKVIIKAGTIPSGSTYYAFLSSSEYGTTAVANLPRINSEKPESNIGGSTYKNGVAITAFTCPTDDTTCTGYNYTFEQAYYKEAVKNSTNVYLTIYSIDNSSGVTKYQQLTISALLGRQTGANALNNSTIFPGGYTTTDLSSTHIGIKDVNIENTGNYFAVISKSEADFPDPTFADGGVKETDLCEGKTSTCRVVHLSEYKNYYMLGSFSDYVKLAELKGPTYIGFYNRYGAGNTYFLVSEITPLNFTLPEVPLGSRMHVFPWANRTSVFLYGLNGIDTPRSFAYSIGLVEDKTIISNIINNKAGAHEALLEYANNHKAIKTGSITVNNGDIPALFSKSDVKAGKYYYVYFGAIDTDVYNPMEDIALYRATQTNTLDLLREGEFDYDTPSQTKPKKNPKTGIINYSILAAIVAGAGIIIYIKTKKVTKFPQS